MIARTPFTSLQKLTLSSKLGLVSIPESGSRAAEPTMVESGFDCQAARELLQTLGRDLGMTLLTVRPETFLDEESNPVLPDQASPAFPDEAIRKTVEGLDVVWLQGNEIVAAFVLEAGPVAGAGNGPWEGLRRIADWIALNPKMKTACYAVSVPALKAGLVTEMHRPVYRLLKKPLPEVVRILDWSRLQLEVTQLGERVRYLKAEFLDGISDIPEVPSLA